MVLIVPVAATVSLAIDPNLVPCIAIWSAPDIADDLTFCRAPISEMLTFKYYVFPAMIGYVCMLNIVFAMIFTVKLRNVLKMAEVRSSKMDDQQFKLREMIVKLNCLTIIGMRFHYK